jgi:hypothetical protein
VLFEINEFVLFGGLVVVYLAATEAGYRLGRRRARTFDDSDKSHSSALQSALLGLLALLLGFSFAMGVSRYDLRKRLLLEEVNAIGTTYLRAAFLPTERAAEAKALLRSYVDARLKFVGQDISMAQVEELYASAGSINQRLWSIAREAAAQDPKSVPTGLFISSLNEMIDVAEARRAAYSNHIPEAIVLLLVLVSCGAFGFIGINRGVVGPRNLPATTTFIVLSAMVMIIILDVDRPRRGFILVNQDIMVRLQSNLAREAIGEAQ